jgi:3-deoxy-D-manno-octulosonic-acid transferase
MTNRSLKSYRKLSWLFRGTLRQFHEICAQSSETFENLLAYGLYKKNIKLSRNMKFDLTPDAADEQLGKKIVTAFSLQNKPILVAASTHDTEEKLLLDSYRLLKQQHRDLILVVVPRHPHRFDSAYQIVNASGFETIRISDYVSDDNHLRTSDIPIECLVVDTMGWLKACYSISTLAFIGGSFADKGGHNALEAALYAIPMVMGPSVYNNPIICQHLQEQNALVIVKSADELYKALEHWLTHTESAVKDGECGSKVLLRNTGAVEYTMSVIRPYLTLPPTTKAGS